MSDDAETRRQIAELAHDTRPLLVLDVDEVLLEFVDPFSRFLKARGHELRTDSFRLHGNVFNLETDEAAKRETVSDLLESFFEVQHEWQTAVYGAAEALAALAPAAEIVMLTAMPHRHRDRRRRLLDDLDFHYPLLTTEAAKGPAIRQLRGKNERPVAFVDDIPHNLMSVRKTLPAAHLFHLMAHPAMRQLLPPLEEDIEMAENWPDVRPKIATALGI